jgi:DNA-binding transcriptional MerR regulator
MNNETEFSQAALQPFTADPETFYSLEAAAHLARIPRHIVLVCCRRGIISPRIDPDFGGFSFDYESVRTLQHIEYLRTARGVNLEGIEIILRLMDEVRLLRAAVDGNENPEVTSHPGV